jgi:hypothetical protein
VATETVRIEVDVNDQLAEVAQQAGADMDSPRVSITGAWFSGSSYSDVTIEFEVEDGR